MQRVTLPRMQKRPSLRRLCTRWPILAALGPLDSQGAVTHIRRNDVETACTVCGRTLLLGERLVTYHRPEERDAHVCELCIDQADARGWAREGSDGPPPQPQEPRRRGLRKLL